MLGSILIVAHLIEKRCPRRSDPRCGVAPCPKSLHALSLCAYCSMFFLYLLGGCRVSSRELVPPSVRFLFNGNCRHCTRLLRKKTRLLVSPLRRVLATRSGALSCFTMTVQYCNPLYKGRMYELRVSSPVLGEQRRLGRGLLRHRVIDFRLTTRRTTLPSTEILRTRTSHSLIFLFLPLIATTKICDRALAIRREPAPHANRKSARGLNQGDGRHAATGVAMVQSLHAAPDLSEMDEFCTASRKHSTW